MKDIIQKAIEGGWKPCDLIDDYSKVEIERNEVHFGTWFRNPEGDGCFIEDSRHAFLSADFWQALGKACGWDTNINPNKGWFVDWKTHALKFHEVNLTKGWDAAVSWLEALISGNK